ncbi:MAG: hypothetical protein LBS42_01285 [Tannerella sp.]|nr:hypothetical protein [Tannerella sp.]
MQSGDVITMPDDANLPSILDRAIIREVNESDSYSSSGTPTETRRG